MLVLGGTAEARALVEAMDRRGWPRATLALAGATRAPRARGLEVRTGGFGGAEGLRRHLRERRVRALVDATHPYAARMSAQAAAAAGRAGVPRLRLWRAPWTPWAGDRWSEVTDEATAAREALALGRRPLVTLGARGGARFPHEGFEQVFVRAIEPPAARTAGVTWLHGEPPFTLEDERALLLELRIDVLVSRNAGGGATRAKLDAARAQGLPVVLIERPTPPPGPLAASVEAALAWLDQVLASRQT